MLFFVVDGTNWWKWNETATIKKGEYDLCISKQSKLVWYTSYVLVGDIFRWYMKHENNKSKSEIHWSQKMAQTAGMRYCLFVCLLLHPKNQIYILELVRKQRHSKSKMQLFNNQVTYLSLSWLEMAFSPVSSSCRNY